MTSKPQSAPANLPEAVSAAVDSTTVAPAEDQPESENVLALDVPRYLDEADLRSPERRRLLPALLLAATCFTTYATGAYNWKDPGFLTFDGEMFHQLRDGWRNGLIYMCSVLAVLMAHEMGHFLMTVRHRIRSSYPLFIPLPVTLTGTMGAVIVMEGARANRKQLFDIGIAGPLAGLVLIVPLVVAGIRTAPAMPRIDSSKEPMSHFGDPLIVKLLTPVLRPELKADQELGVNSMFMAGWVGLLVTGLNMLPISQLDGGHVAYAVFGRGSRWIARGVLGGALIFIIAAEQYNWTLMLVVVTLLGIYHPPSSNDRVELGWGRRILGTLSLAIPIFCFTPYPIY